MTKYLAATPLLAILLVTACDEGAVSPMSEAEGGPSEIVVTQGVVAPEARPFPFIPMKSDFDGAEASLGGSTAAPITLKANTCTDGTSQQITVTYTIDGNQAGTATFDVNTKWVYNGTNWTGSVPVTVTVAPRAPSDPPTLKPVQFTFENASAASSGTSHELITPFNITNSNTTGAKLSLNDKADVTVHVAFDACPVTNTPPTLMLPNDITAEATSAAGALVTYVASASDTQDGALTPVCTPASGSIFALGATTVNCSVTDSGGLTTSGSFIINIEDTTPPAFTSFPGGTQTRIAQSINGWAFDLSGFGLTAEDFGNVSEPATIACDVVDGTMLALGGTHPVSCTTTDAIGNESAASTFEVLITLDLSGLGFLTPLRMEAPYSSHKLGSTIPHKFPAPMYADGTLATDLAAGLRLVLSHQGSSDQFDTTEEDDYSAGSTTWRWDEISQHYIYNLKTPKTGWKTGMYMTEASFAGIELAQTMLELRK